MIDNRVPGTPERGRRHVLRLGMAAVAAALAPFSSMAQTLPSRRLDVPYDPSPQYVVHKMLELAAVSKNDLLYDLGCGDGRIVITAAVEHDTRGVGIDLDPQRIEEAKANAKLAGVEDRVKFLVGDLYTASFGDATVVTLFLWPHVNRKLRPILWRQLNVGTRVTSHLWDMGPEWPPEKTVHVQGRKIHLWTVTEAQKKMAS